MNLMITIVTHKYFWRLFLPFFWRFQAKFGLFFCSGGLNVKCPVFKISCTHAQLCQENPFNHFNQNVFSQPPLAYPVNFVSVNPHNFHLSLFAGMTTEQGERRRSHQSAPITNLTNIMSYCYPYHLPLKLRKDKTHYTLRHSVSLRVSRGNFPFCFAKYFSMHSPCYSFDTATTHSDNTTPLIQ